MASCLARIVINYFWCLTSKLVEVFHFGRTLKHKHDTLWDIAFPKNKKWLSVASAMGLVPALVGQGVRTRYDGSREEAYIVLVTGDYSGDLQLRKQLLLDCLELDNDKRRFNERTQEVVLKEHNITLNIEDAYLSFESIRLDPKRLFSKNCVSSAALFWGDHDLRIIGPDDVVGIGGRASDLKSVASWCAIELTHPMMREKARWNQSFENPYHHLDVRPIGFTGRLIHGWRLVSWRNDHGVAI